MNENGIKVSVRSILVLTCYKMSYKLLLLNNGVKAYIEYFCLNPIAIQKSFLNAFGIKHDWFHINSVYHCQFTEPACNGIKSIIDIFLVL